VNCSSQLEILSSPARRANAADSVATFTNETLEAKSTSSTEEVFDKGEMILFNCGHVNACQDRYDHACF
jgi:hypothetical protein